MPISQSVQSLNSVEKGHRSQLFVQSANLRVSIMNMFMSLIIMLMITLKGGSMENLPHGDKSSGNIAETRN